MASTKIQFSLRVTGQERKSIAASVSGCVDAAVGYTGVPSCAYQIGGWTLDRESNLHSPEMEESEFSAVGQVLFALQGAELHTEGSMKIAIPDMEEHAAENFGNILKSKQQLLKSALQSDNEILHQKGENSISLSCFHASLDAQTVLAYLHFTIKLGNLAKTLRYASPIEKSVENEKYAFRCLLLRLGFIGPEYKAERKILLAPLGGNSAFKNRVLEVAK